MDIGNELHYLSRWIHYIAGVAWIGHLYFFNFVNVNVQPKLDADTKKKVNPEIMPRALFLFRWGAMFTFITGIIMLHLLWGFPMDWSRWQGNAGLWMATGAIFGTIMWFNVWFVIWPAQKKIIGGLQGGPAPAPELAPRAALFSKINTYLSLPMLMGMMIGAHGYPMFGGTVVSWVVGNAVGLGLVWVGYKLAPKISTQIAASKPSAPAA